MILSGLLAYRYQGGLGDRAVRAGIRRVPALHNSC